MLFCFLILSDSKTFYNITIPPAEELSKIVLGLSVTFGCKSKKITTKKAQKNRFFQEVEKAVFE